MWCIETLQSSISPLVQPIITNPIFVFHSVCKLISYLTINVGRFSDSLPGTAFFSALRPVPATLARHLLRSVTFSGTEVGIQGLFDGLVVYKDKQQRSTS